MGSIAHERVPPSSHLISTSSTKCSSSPCYGPYVPIPVAGKDLRRVLLTCPRVRAAIFALKVCHPTSNWIPGSILGLDQVMLHAYLGQLPPKSGRVNAAAQAQQNVRFSQSVSIVIADRPIILKACVGCLQAKNTTSSVRTV